MEQDLVHKRPFLFVSLIFGLTYPLNIFINLPDFAIILWKMGAVASLALYALRNHSHGHFLILVAFLAFYALGDGLVEFDLLWGGISFVIGHCIAIYLYSRHRRATVTRSQKTLALAVIIFVPLLSWLFTVEATGEGGFDALLYGLILAVMTAMAWTSAFPRYRTGLGAMLFIISDLILFTSIGIPDSIILSLAAWYSYYFGVFLITTGIVQTMRQRGI